MPVTCSIKRGDTKGKFVDTLTLNGVPVNLTGCQPPRFLMRRVGKPQKHVDQVGVIVGDPLAGGVEYQPILADIDVGGVYEQEWEVTFASGQVLTFPNNGYNGVNIMRDLGGSTGGSQGPQEDWVFVVTFGPSDVNVAQDRIQLQDHGLLNGDKIRFVPAFSSILPAPLASATTYFVVNASNNNFHVSATEGGVAIDINTSGSGQSAIIKQV